jgi:hypothetical protein
MAAVADLERFLERVFERTSARVFRSRVQAEQAERRLERAMEAGRTGRGTATVVPNRFRVRMHPSDLDDLASRSGGPEALAARLADRALAFARLHGYHLPARPSVSVVADPIVERGMVEVDASVVRSSPPSVAPLEAAVEPPVAPVVSRSQPPPPDADTPSPPEPAAAEPERDDLAALVSPAPVEPPSETPAAAPPVAEASPPLGATPAHAPNPAVPSLRNATDRPYAIRPAAPPPAQALLRVIEPGGREREMRVEARPLTLGRALDNDLAIADSRVSRHHGRFQTRHGTLVYTDLGSTNGTRVNGIRVDDIVLGAGDRLQVGDVVVVVEQLPR